MTRLPSTWERVRLGDACVFNPRHPRALPDAHPVAFVSMQAVDEVEGEIRGAEARTLGQVRRGYTHFADGDVLFAKITPCMQNGKHAVATGLVGGLGCGSTEFFVLRPRADVSAEYVHCFVRQPSFLRRAAEAMTGAVGQARVPREFLEQARLPLPPLAEQLRIVEKVRAWGSRSRRARQALGAVPALLIRLRQAALAAAFRGELTADWRAKDPDVEPVDELLARIRGERRQAGERASDEEPARAPGPGGLPATWRWASWREVGLSQNGRMFPSEHYGDSGCRLLRPGNLDIEGGLTWTADNTRYMPERWAEQYPEYIINEGDIVINLTAQSLRDEFLGRTCQAGPGERCLLNQRIARLTPICVDPRYVLWNFKSARFRRFVAGLHQGSLIQHMYSAQVGSYLLPIPPLAEQIEIRERLDRWSRGLTAARAALRSLDSRCGELDEAILARAFNGELARG